MFTLLSEEPGEIAQFRAEPWAFQQTFKTPLKELNRFVSIFLSPFSFAEGVLSTDEMVFEAKNTLHLLGNNSLSVEDQYHLVIKAVGQQAIVDLLEATLADWIDFLFLPSPQALAIYADHDEYTTFYAPDSATLEELGSGLAKAGFEAVLDYKRGCSGDGWR
jgi:hypothetical protein